MKLKFFYHKNLMLWINITLYETHNSRVSPVNKHGVNKVAIPCFYFCTLSLMFHCQSHPPFFKMGIESRLQKQDAARVDEMSSKKVGSKTTYSEILFEDGIVCRNTARSSIRVWNWKCFKATVVLCGKDRIRKIVSPVLFSSFVKSFEEQGVVRVGHAANTSESDW